MIAGSNERRIDFRSLHEDVKALRVTAVVIEAEPRFLDAEELDVIRQEACTDRPEEEAARCLPAAAAWQRRTGHGPQALTATRVGMSPEPGTIP